MRKEIQETNSIKRKRKGNLTLHIELQFLILEDRKIKLRKEFEQKIES